jgi:hypothetical protein
MAYVLGFIYADGSVSAKKNGKKYIKIYSTDKDIIDKIHSLLGEFPLHVDEMSKYPSTSDRAKDCHMFVVSDQVMVQDVWDLGIRPRKSVEWHGPPTVPDEFFWDWLRGFTDGDGSIQAPTLKYPYPRIQWASGTEGFALWLNTSLRRFTWTKSGISKRRGKNCWELKLDKNLARHVIKQMYGEGRISMDRKQLVADDVLK